MKQFLKILVLPLVALGAIASIAVIGFSFNQHKKRKSRINVLGAYLFNEIKLEPEKVDVLVLKDVTTYFKSLMLEKNLDIPFITKYIHKNIEYYLLGTFNNDTEEIQNMKLILPVEVALDVKEILGDEKLVVLT